MDCLRVESSVIAILVVIADIWLVIADLIRNPWIQDQVRDDNFLVRDDKGKFC